MRLRFKKRSRKAWTVTSLAAKSFLRIDGTFWAGSFAFNAFLSLFPLMLLFVAIASFFIDRDSAGEAIVTYVEDYVPLDGEMQEGIFGAIVGVIESRQQAGVLALLVLIWSALQAFMTLVRITNLAWGDDGTKWWRLPLRGMTLLGVTGGALLLGMTAPALASLARSWFLPANDIGSWVYALWGHIVPILVLFLSLALFYKLAPSRKTRFAEVWIAAACATALLQAIESLFALYLDRFATLNAVYGVFGGITALLLWIYLSGCGFIFGVCLCVAQARAEEGCAPAPTNGGGEHSEDHPISSPRRQ